MRWGVAAILVAFSTAGLSQANEAKATISQFVNVPAQPLRTALAELARTRDLQIIYHSEVVGARRSAGAVGEFTPEQELARLLYGTGLTYRYLNNTTVTIVPTASIGGAPSKSTATGSAKVKEGKTASSARFRMARMAGDKTQESASIGAADAGSSAASPTLEEVVVTAQKRTQRLSDVPMSVAVLSGDKLVRSQSNTLQDIVDKVPGVQLVSGGPTTNEIVIRGMYLGSGINSSVATYVDEVPYTSEGPFAYSSNIAPNFDPYDLARVEVLRGPQGTLYGANSLAGLLKYVTNAPDPSGYSASFLAGESSTEHGGDGYEVHGMVNLPLGDTAALRIVANDTYFPGYIDDAERHISGLNAVDRYGVRASLLWQATPDLTVRLSAAYQYLKTPDAGVVDLSSSLKPIYGDLTQERAVAQPNSVVNEIYNGTIDWKLGFATLVSSTSYSEVNPKAQIDLSSVFGPILDGIFGGNYGSVAPSSEPVHSVTQELRLASPNDQRLEWIVGGYFTDEAADEQELQYPVDLNNGQILTSFTPNLGAYYITSTYREEAGFGDLTYHLTQAFELGLGGRYSSNQQTYHQVNAGLFTGTDDFQTPSRQSVSTYSVDAKYRFGPDTMAYGRIASGFVPGGPNDVLPGSPLPTTFRSSSDTSYELGVKGNVARGTVTYDLDAFDVEWQDIQLEAEVNDLYAITNGGAARSRGLEGELSYAPVQGLNLSAGGAYTDARLTQDTPASFGGLAGNRLPLSPFFSGNLSADYERPLGRDLSGFGGLDWRYSGDRISDFTFGAPRATLPSYSMVNLRAGLKLRLYVLTVYVKNVGDVRAINTVSSETIAGNPAWAATVAQPRTVGVTLSASF
jgi:outer membrane receptor protein involved in Fe transport